MYLMVVANFMYYVTVAAKLVRSWFVCCWFEIIRGFTDYRVIRA
jgi:hypothetical protein